MKPPPPVWLATGLHVHVLVAPLAIPPPPRETVTWPKKHRKYQAPKKNFLWVYWKSGGGVTVSLSPPPPRETVARSGGGDCKGGGGGG